MRPPTPAPFSSRLRSPATGTRFGLWLGISFAICFLTGLRSHDMVISGLGVRTDNPTLLDRPYLATWWAISAIVVLVVALTGFVRSRRHATDRPRARG